MSRGTHQPLCSATFQKSIQYHRCVGCHPACQRCDSSRKQILLGNKWEGKKKKERGREMTGNIYNVPTNRSAAWRWDKSHLMCAVIREGIVINKREGGCYGGWAGSCLESCLFVCWMRPIWPSLCSTESITQVSGLLIRCMSSHSKRNKQTGQILLLNETIFFGIFKISFLL